MVSTTMGMLSPRYYAKPRSRPRHCTGTAAERKPMVNDITMLNNDYVVNGKVPSTKGGRHSSAAANSIVLKGGRWMHRAKAS